MHCAICDREDDLISMDKRTDTFSDCTVCQAIIQDCIEGYQEIVVPDEAPQDGLTWWDELLGRI